MSVREVYLQILWFVDPQNIIYSLIIAVQNHSGDEDGLVEDDEPVVRYDPEKLIGVPGFNVEPRPGTVDDCWRLGMPPLQPHQSKALAVASMSVGEVEDLPSGGEKERQF